ncbi:MAG: peptidylprolyl isomerase [Coriobacteriia bacterium]|nr:peptidylprolyl isomerase [Coriobacteriia bacterium]
MITRNRALLSAVLAVLMMSALVVAGCAQAPAPVPEEQAPPAETTATSVPEEGQLKIPAYKPNGKETAIFTTSKGEIEVELFGTDAPIHVGNFVELAESGFYADTKFHRFEEGFVVQGGDPQSKEMTSEEVIAEVASQATVLGTGGPGHMIKGEFDPATNPNKHTEGALGMARSQSPDSAGSQFYFTLSESPFLDGNYTVFGQVIKGLDVMQQLRVGDTVDKIVIVGATK